MVFIGNLIVAIISPIVPLFRGFDTLSLFPLFIREDSCIAIGWAVPKLTPIPLF